MSSLHDYAQRRLRGAQVLEELAGALDSLGIEPGGSTPDLRALAERTRAGRFHVLLIGGFSSGKSTLLNALLGQPVLPVKVNPCTAILTELAYSEQQQVEVRFRDGTPPETLTPRDFLERYQLHTDVAEAGAEASDRFGRVARAIVSWPLPLLADGVALLDTPGLDDDEARTARTLASLPEADAVIVVLNATRFLSELERRTIRRQLLPLGLTNLFFPVTMVDLVDALSDDPEGDLREMAARGRRLLGPLCEVDGVDRFDERFFFVDGRGGLRARWDGSMRRAPVDAEALARSGMLPFESALERFLVEERGRVRLVQLAATARRVRDDVRRQADLDRATAAASVEELRERQASLEPRFAELDAIADRVARTVDAFIGRQQQRIWQDLRDFLAQTEDRVPEAIASFDLGGGLDLLTPGRRERLEQRLRDALERWLGEEVATWQATLHPRLEEALHGLRLEVAGDARDFDRLAGRIVTDFAGGLLSVPSAPTRDELDPVERWFSVAVGAVLLSPGAMAAGWSEGYEGALKGAASRLAARVAVIALGALLGPVGWLGLLLYALTDAVLLVVTGGGRARKVREHLGRDLRGKLVAQADTLRPELDERIAAALAPLREGISAGARAEAADLQALLEQTISAREAAVRGASERADRWEAALHVLERGCGELEELVHP